MLHVLRPLVAAWRLLNQERDKRIAASAEQRGRLKEREAIQDTMRPVFDKTPLYIPVAMLPSEQSATYEPPDKHTDKIRPVRPVQLLPADSLKRMIGTEHLPAVNGKAGKLLEKYNEQQRRAAGK